MNAKYKGVLDGVVRFLQKNPTLAKECSEALRSPSLSAATEVGQRVAREMDAANWIHDSDGIGIRYFCEVVSHAVDEVCPYEIEWDRSDDE